MVTQLIRGTFPISVQYYTKIAISTYLSTHDQHIIITLNKIHKINNFLLGGTALLDLIFEDSVHFLKR